MCAKIVDHDGIRTMDFPIAHQNHYPLGYQALLFAMLPAISNKQQAILPSENSRDHSQMKNESVKKLLEKSKNVLAEKCKTVRQKICIKNENASTIIAKNFVREQLFNDSV